MLSLDLFEDFYEPFQILDGAVTRAIVQRVSDAATPPLDFSAPRLICRVRHDSLMHTGQVVVRQKTGVHFIVANHSATPDYRTQWLIEAQRAAAHTMDVTSTDALTGKPMTTGMQDAGDVWVAWEAITRETFDRDMRVRQELVRAISAVDLQLGDQLDGKIIKRKQPVLGVFMYTVQ